MKRYVVKYQIATYSGQEIVYCDENWDNEQIIGKAKSQLKRKMNGLSFPFGCNSWWIEKSEHVGI